MHANYETIENQPALRFERRLVHPVEAVWRALTEPEELAHWFPCQVELELRLGGRMTFTFEDMPVPDGPSQLLGEVTEFDPPRRFAFTWGEDRLHFAIDPIEDGAACVLRFMVELDARDKAARDAAGWHACLDALDRRLSGSDEPAVTGASSAWRDRYQEYERRGFPVGAPLPEA